MHRCGMPGWSTSQGPIFARRARSCCRNRKTPILQGCRSPWRCRPLPRAGNSVWRSRRRSGLSAASGGLTISPARSCRSCCTSRKHCRYGLLSYPCTNVCWCCPIPTDSSLPGGMPIPRTPPRRAFRQVTLIATATVPCHSKAARRHRHWVRLSMPVRWPSLTAVRREGAQRRFLRRPAGCRSIATG